MADPSPEAVKALARLADPEAFGMLGTLNNQVMARSHAYNLLADPGPLLEVLAEAGVLVLRDETFVGHGGGQREVWLETKREVTYSGTWGDEVDA